MATNQNSTIVSRLSSLFPAEWIHGQAVDAGVVQRKRKVKVVPLFWTIILGFGVGVERSIAALRREYGRRTGTTLVPSAFYDRFTRALVELLKRAVARAVDVASESSRKLRARLQPFRDLIVSDATVLRVHRLLEDRWAGSSEQVAAVKMHVVFSVLGASPRRVTITGQRAHEAKMFKVGPWVKGCLLLFDLGYYRHALFARINGHGGYFVSRLKSHANPTILSSNRRHRGRARDLAGVKLQAALVGLRRGVVDVQVELAVHRRRPTDRDLPRKMTAQVVGLRDDKTGELHLYLTNVGPEHLAAEDIPPVYAARWQIELLFRQLKTYLRAGQLPSAKQEIVLALLYAAILACTVSRVLLHQLRQRIPDGDRRLPEERWSAVFHQTAHAILALLLRSLGFRNDRLSLEDLLLHEALDPNRSRSNLIALAEGV